MSTRHWFWSKRPIGNGTHSRAQLVFGKTSFGRSINRTQILLKRQLWIWPVIAVALLSIIGYSIRNLIHQTMESNLKAELTTLLSVERSMLEKWLRVQEASAVALANDEQIRGSALKIIAANTTSPPTLKVAGSHSTKEELVALHSQFIKELEPGLWSQGFVGFDLIDKQQRVICAYTEDMIGQSIPELENVVAQALDGKPAVSVPFPSTSMLKDRTGKLRSGTPTMFVCSPILNENLQVVAVLALRIRPEKEFTQILELGRMGETGETYAFNGDGLMVSNSRFDSVLILMGVLPDTDAAASILNLRVCDPEGNLQEGFRPKLRRRELSLTKGCEAAIAGNSGINLAGYRSYRGTPVVGAWVWMPDYRIGLITEMEYSEAFRPLTILSYSFYALFALLAICSLAIFVFTVIVARLQREAQKAEIEAKQLGQYRLETKIGAGAMGIVYRGQHAMLRRPTAIKILNIERANESAIQRFEHEVQMTCQLNNPHTVAIYDYGRTPEGTFYYAMEYLDGIDLQSLVDRYGLQSEGRVAHILRQVCESLAEAHSLGLIHRDIKPANIMLNFRGGCPDFVKVLDFGLVKAVHDDSASVQGLSGTPLYMSPEAIQTPNLVDTRSDLYAVGAVGYFLLTGETAFKADTLVDLCQMHTAQLVATPSQRLGRTISSDLENAILSCLEKDRVRRPQTARDLSNLLDNSDKTWSFSEAEAWWRRHERAQHSVSAASSRNLENAPVDENTAIDARTNGSSENTPPIDRTIILQSHDSESCE